MKTTRSVVSALIFSLIAGAANAVDLKRLPYPTSAPGAEDIIRQVYFVNHFYAYRNFSITERGKTEITVLLSRAEGDRPKTETVERHLNNNYDDGIVQSRDLAIFQSGKLRGTGILITDYVDDEKSQSYVIWLPSLRKIRRFAEPAHEDAWGGTDFTFGDVVLRKPKDETHELLETTKFEGCLGRMELGEQRVFYLDQVPEASCRPNGREVYVVRSTPKRANWWYDYRDSYVDTKSFADYRTRYYKDGTEIKIIDRDWRSMGLEDPRAQAWGYWYGKVYSTGHETWAIIPPSVVEFNQDVDDDLWTERTLRRIKR